MTPRPTAKFTRVHIVGRRWLNGWGRVGVAVLVSASGLVVLAPATPVAAISSEVQIDIPTAGPLGAITVIGDSVLVGAAIEPTLAELLNRSGWGPVRYRAGLGYTAGNFQPAGSTFSVANYIKWWRAAGWDAPNVMVNLGNNDVGFCKADLACNAGTIRYVLDAIGPGHTVWWSKITRFPYLQSEADAYNGALELVAAERGNLRVWDWPAARTAEGIPLSWDMIHLPESTSYRRRSVLMAADATRQLAVGRHTGTDASLPAGLAPSAEYIPIGPTRVLDTRALNAGRLAAGGTVEVDLSTFVPVGTSSVAVNITSVDPGGAGFLTGFACGPTRPLTSSGNYVAGVSRSAMSVLTISADRRLCIYSSAAADVVVDLQGGFVAEGQRLTPTVPARLLDTRTSGRLQEMRVPMPAGASAVALNLAVTGSGAAGFITAYPCGAARPNAATVTFGANETISGAAFVPVGGDGSVCVYANVAVDVIIDLTGTFSATGDLAFVAVTPTRVYDTRDGTGGWTPIQGAGQTVDIRVAPPEARAVSGTLTIVSPATAGFLAAFGCGDRPTTASVNGSGGGIVANTVTVGLATGGTMCVLSSIATGVVFDTTGWWIP